MTECRRFHVGSPPAGICPFHGYLSLHYDHHPVELEAATTLCDYPSKTYPGTYPVQRLYHLLTCSFSCQVAIVKLPIELLLSVFHHYLYTSPQGWPTLTHVCGWWRHVVLTSPLWLRLRLYCTYGTPVLKYLDSWPSFPLVISYGGSPVHNPPAPEDDENIVAAFKQSHRVYSISLTVTKSLLKNMSAISEPFPILEELVLLYRDGVQVTLPSTFRWGPRLRTLHLTRFRIPFPALLQHLSPPSSLVDLHLHDIPSDGYFPPDAFANALSELAQLETLSLHFLTLPPRRTFVGLTSRPSNRVTLPGLTCLKYRGTSTYLDRFVARIDAPRLGDIGVTFFGQPTMDASQLGRFIERIETLTSLHQADVQISARDIAICCSRLGTLTQLKLQISWGQLDWQLFSLTQICVHLSPFLHRVQDLRISSTQSTSENADMDGQQWQDLMRVFGGTKDFHVAGAHVKAILCALFSADEPPESGTTVLPTLCNLLVKEPILISGPLMKAKESFITSRGRSGRHVEFNTVRKQSTTPVRDRNKSH